MRKETGFEVSDHITIEYSAGDVIKNIFEKFSSEISKETLTDSVTFNKDLDTEEISVNGENVRMKLDKSI